MFDSIINSVFFYPLVDCFLFIFFLYLSFFLKEKICNLRYRNLLIRTLKAIVKISFLPIYIYIVIKFVAYNHKIILYIFEDDFVNGNNGENYMYIVSILFKVMKGVKFFCVLLIIHNTVCLFIEKNSRYVNDNSKNEKARALNFIVKIIECFLLFVFIVFLLWFSNVNIKTIVATVLTPLLTVTYIFKNKINDLFNGIVLVLSNNYKVNDVVEIKEKNIEGIIRQITLVYVKVQTFSNSIISMSTSNFMESNVLKKNILDFWTINMFISCTFKDDAVVNELIEEIENYYKHNSSKISKQSTIIKNIQDNMLFLEIYFCSYVKKISDMFNIKKKVSLDLYKILKDKNCENIEVKEIE